MLLWVCLIALCSVVVWALLQPLIRGVPTLLQSSDADLAVYRDQLAEIDADLVRELIGEDQAEAARIEIARRLLSESDKDASAVYAGEDASEAQQRTTSFQRITATAMAIAVPVVALVLYVQAGSPTLPSQPLAERQSKDLEKATGFELIKRVEARLQSNPGEGRGWDVLAPIYLQLRRFDDAAEAFRNSIALLGETPKRLIGYIQARIAADNGVITDDTLNAIKRAGEIAPDRPEPRFWRALAKEQDGDLQGAEADYRAMLDEAKPDDQWVTMVSERLAVVTEKSGSKN